MKFPEWNVVFWFVLACVFGGLELLGVFDGHFATATDLLRKYIPLWGRAMILGWLVWHFLIAPDNWVQYLPKP